MTRQSKYSLIIILLLFAHFCSAKDIYVSPAGSDQAEGTQKAPFKSLRAALESARQYEDCVTIWMPGGIYPLTETIRLSENDSHSEKNRLTIRSMPGEEVILRGGRSIPAGLFSRLVDPKRLSRLAEKARGKVFTASLEGTGLEQFFTASPTNYRRKPYAMLTWNGYTLQQARWPNRGYAWIDKTLEKGPTTRWGWDPVAYDYDHPIGGRFTARKDGLLPGESKLDFAALKREFDRTQDMTAVGYLSVDWRRRFDPIGRIYADEESIQLLGPTDYGIDFKKLPLTRRFYLLNTLCQLDEPGEWYYDYQEKLLYLWPVQTTTDENQISIAGGPTLIEAEGASYVTLCGITFENFGGRGVEFRNSSHIFVAGCTFRSGNGQGLTVTGGIYNGITGCDFYDVETAFTLSGRPENRRRLIAEHNYATNNHIHHCRRRGYGLLSIAGVGVQFAHNLLHNQNGGMFYGDNDAVIEFNEFYDMGYEMGDWNVAYNGADLAKINNQFRHNFVHHLLETPRGYPIAAARADDGGSGLCAAGNILYKCGRSGMEFYGPANTIVNNVVMETGHLWWTQQRPKEIISKTEFMEQKRKEDREIRRTYVKADVIGKAERLLGPKFWMQDTVWTQRYPHLKDIFDLQDYDHCPWAQTYCRIENNYIWHGKDFPIHYHGDNLIETPEDVLDFLPKTARFEMPIPFDPVKMFVDPDNMDFRFHEGFEAVAGFEEIPFERIGLYLDEYRRKMPDKRQYRLDVMNKYKGIPSYGGKFDLAQINQRYSPPDYLRFADRKSAHMSK